MIDWQPIVSWVAPIVSTVIIGFLTTSINAHVSEMVRRREAEEVADGAKREAEAAWRELVEGMLREQDGKIDAIRQATQTTMRTDLIHLYEKYVTRSWLTPEERAAWIDMHEKYAALDANGLIDSYRRKIERLPDREIR